MTNTKVTKIVSGFVAFATAFSMLVGASAAAAQTTNAASLQAQIAALQAQLNASTGMMAAPAYSFSANLSLGSKGQDVWNLQKVLNMSADTQVALTGAGSPGNETSTFGPATKRAVMKFQAKYGISQTGTVGPITRAKLNSMSAAPVVTGPTGTPVVVSGPLQVTLGTTASYGALVSPSATAILATYNFAGNGVVTNVTLNRNGVSTDNTLSNVYLYNGATRLTDAASVSSGVISFNNPAGLFTVNGSLAVTVRADVAPSYGGNTVGVTLASYNTAGGNSVAVNLAGPIQTIATNSNAATVTVGTQAITAQNINAGSTGFQVWSAPVVVGTRSVSMQAVSFKYIGSAPTNALSNIKLLVDGAQVGPIGAVNANGYLTFDLSASPLVLNTGSHTVVVQADIVAGANRNFQISLQNSGDLMVADSQLQGVNVAPTNANGSTFTSNIGGLITINNGTLVVQTDPSFSPTTITGGAANVTIAQFKMTSYGEDVKVNSLQVEPQINGADTSLNNVGVYVNGGQVGSTMNDATTTLTFGSNNLFTIPAGQTVTVAIKADTISAQNTNYSAGTLTVKLPQGSSNAQGVQSSQITSVPAAAISSNGILLATGAISLGVNPAFPAQSIVANTANQRIGSFVLQQNSSEAAQLTNITVAIGGTIPLTSLQNLKVSLGTNTVGQLTSSNNFSVNTLIPANSSQTLDVYADVGQVPAAVTSNTRSFTFTGTYAAGNLATTTISGTTFTTGSFIAGTSATTIASQMAALINASSSPIFTATASGATVTLTAVTPGAAANSYTVTAGQSPAGIGSNLTVTTTVSGGVALTSATIIPTVTVTARGATSNVTISPAPVTGSTITVGSGALTNPPTAVANASLPSQYIVGGASNVQYANFNFISTTGTSNITELRFATNQNGNNASSITKVTVGGQTGNVVNGVADVTGLNIPVAITGGGVNVPVAVSLAPVGQNGIATGLPAGLQLTYVGYSTGNSNTNISGLTVNATGTLYLTDSKPTVTYASTTGTHAGLNNNDLIDVTITNDQNGGPLTIDAIPLTFTSNKITFGNQPLVVKDVTNNNAILSVGGSGIATSSSWTGITSSGTASTVITFTGGYRLEHGASVTFAISGTATDNGNNTAGSDTLLTSLGAASAFTWSDIAGGDTAGSGARSGTLTSNYPTSGGNTITN